MIRTVLFILFFGISSQILGQEFKVYGSIVDQENLDALIGVHVFTSVSNGTTSDIDGNFHLSVKQNDTLHFSMLGYETLKFVMSDSVDSQDMIITLKQSTIVLKNLEFFDYFQANTIIKTKERDIYRVPGVRYPAKADPNQYQYMGANFSLYRAALTMSRKDYKQHKKLYNEFPDKQRNDRAVESAKEKINDALDALGERLDDYYIIDFIQFTGMTVASVNSRTTYDLIKILPGQVDRYMEALHAKDDEE